MRWFSHRFQDNVWSFCQPEEGCVGLAGFSVRGETPSVREDAGHHLVEVQLSGRNHLEHHFAKHYGSSETRLLRFAGERCEATPRGERYAIAQRNECIETETCFESFSGVRGFCVTQTVRNLGPGEIVLDYVSAFQFAGAAGGRKGTWQENAFVWLPHNYWKAECSWRRYAVRELGLYDCSEFSAKRIALANTGTWSTKEYLPMGILEDGLGGEMLFWSVEGSLAWNWELSTAGGGLYLAAGGPSLQETGWQRTLAPGERYETPRVFVTAGRGLEEVFAAVTDYRRAARLYDPRPFGLLPVFNDYMNCLDTDPSTEKELPLIERAARLGCRYYMIDAGWYTDGFWWDDTGEWRAAPNRFRNGLEFVLGEIRRHGMVPGLWVEIEVMSAGLPLARRLPDDWFFVRNGRRVVDNSRYLLNFANPAVREFADGVIDRLVREYGAGFVKMDHNVNGGVGTGPGNFGEGLERHWRGYLEWLAGVTARYPQVVFENCASGGCRMEYGLLERCHLQSTSDQTDCRLYAAIAANCVTAVTPEQAGVWAYPLAGDDEEAVVFNMVNAILLHVYLSGRIDLLDEGRLELVAEGIRINQALAETILRGHPFWPLGLAAFDDKVAAFGLEYGGKRYLCVWNRNNLAEIRIPLAGCGATRAECLYPRRLPTELRVDGDTLTLRPHRETFARLLQLS